MSIASGVAKRLAVKAESTFGTAAGASGAQIMRRVQSRMKLAKPRFESQEISDTRMISDSRHGTRSVQGSISGELSGGSYQAFIQSALRRAATATANMTGLTLTVAASGSLFTIERSAGSWISAGVVAGMVVRATAGLNANTLNRNLLVLAVTTTVLTVATLDASGALTAESAVGSCTVTVAGKYTYVPTTGHTDQSFTIEEWHSDISVSRLATGCKVNTVGLKLPSNGMSTIELAYLGQDLTIDTAEYFSSPTAASTSGIAAAVNGALYQGTTQVALCTGLNLNINGGMSIGEVIGSGISPDVFEGRVRVTGDMMLYMEDETYLSAFRNDTELSLAVVLLETEDEASDYQAIYVPRLKLDDADIDDGEKGLIITCPFTALRKGTATGINDTVLQIHDSRYT